MRVLIDIAAEFWRPAGRS